MRRRALCLCILAMLAWSCGTTGSDSDGVVVTDDGLRVFQPAGRAPQLSYAVVLTNTRSDRLARDVEIDVTLVSAQGADLSKVRRVIAGIPGGQKTAIGDTDSAARVGSGDATSARSMRVAVHVGRWEQQPGNLGTLSIVSKEQGAKDSWSELVTFDSTFTRPVWNVTVVAVYANSQQAILGGSSGCTAEVDPGDNTGETSTIDPIPGADEVAAFVQWKEPSDEGPSGLCD